MLFIFKIILFLISTLIVFFVKNKLSGLTKLFSIFFISVFIIFIHNSYFDFIASFFFIAIFVIYILDELLKLNYKHTKYSKIIRNIKIQKK